MSTYAILILVVEACAAFVLICQVYYRGSVIDDQKEQLAIAQRKFKGLERECRVLLDQRAELLSGPLVGPLLRSNQPPKFNLPKPVFNKERGAVVFAVLLLMSCGAAAISSFICFVAADFMFGVASLVILLLCAGIFVLQWGKGP